MNTSPKIIDLSITGKIYKRVMLCYCVLSDLILKLATQLRLVDPCIWSTMQNKY